MIIVVDKIVVLVFIFIVWCVWGDNSVMWWIERRSVGGIFIIYILINGSK